MLSILPALAAVVFAGTLHLDGATLVPTGASGFTVLCHGESVGKLASVAEDGLVFTDPSGERRLGLAYSKGSPRRLVVADEGGEVGFVEERSEDGKISWIIYEGRGTEAARSEPAAPGTDVVSFSGLLESAELRREGQVWQVSGGVDPRLLLAAAQLVNESYTRAKGSR